MTVAFSYLYTFNLLSVIIQISCNNTVQPALTKN